MATKKGQYVTIDIDNPQALGICDRTGFVHNRKDLVKQMEWRGDSLVWTGFLVGRDFVDVPNEQSRPPILPPDPVPVIDPRVMQNQEERYSNNNLPVISECYFWMNSLADTNDGTLVMSQSQIRQQLNTASFVTGSVDGGDFGPNQAEILAELNSARFNE